MKLSLNWLNEYIDLTGKTGEEIGEKLTLHTCELEEVLESSKDYEKVVVGELKEIKAHPEAEKLSVAQMDCGKHGIKQIIFGQVHEVNVGEKVPVALPGAKLKSGINIEGSEIRGEKSEGMITDNQELGMKNPGLLRFDNSVENGSLLEEVCPEFGDVLLDIDNKSLTHRPDLMGHAGFVRELKAIYKTNGEWDWSGPKMGDPEMKVDVRTDVCRRFIALEMKNILVEDSDITTMLRLEHLGVRSISNMVDITNWIMLGYGQPMHVFDADRIEGKLIIRQALKGEILLALDGEEYELNESDTVVADEKKVLSIAGIMGGMESGVTNETKNIVFECANWDPVAIRKTSTRLGLRSDSSMRYEKSLDPENCSVALSLAVDLALKACPNATVVGGFVDLYPQPFKDLVLDLSTQEVREKIGVEISDEEQKAFLESLDFGVLLKDGILTVEVPSYRNTKDIQIGADLIEEIVRLYGFDNIPPTLPPLSAEPPKENHLRSLEWWLRDFWAGKGYIEAQHYVYVSDNDPFLDKENVLEIANPLSSETTFMRQTLLSGMMKGLETEVRVHRDVQVFELGKTYIPVGEVLPKEELHLGIIRSSMEQDEEKLFFDLKASFEQFFEAFGLKIDFEQGSDLPWAHPGRATTMKFQGISIGSLFVVHPSFRTCESATVYGEVNLEFFESLCSKFDFSYQAPSNFPPVRRDIAFVVDEKAASGEIEKALLDLDNIDSVHLFDEFMNDEKVGVGKKNLAYHITLLSYEKTLEEESIMSTMKAVSNILKTKFNADIR